MTEAMSHDKTALMRFHLAMFQHSGFVGADLYGPAAGDTRRRLRNLALSPFPDAPEPEASQ